MNPIPVQKCLNIVVALNCESSPLVDHFGLKKQQRKGFDLFQSQGERNINLVVAGIGKLNCAAAVAWLASQTDHMDSVWLNVGTAGHLNRTIGDLLWVHCCSDESTTRSHFPPLVVGWKGETISLLSCESPVSEYPPQDAVDMEARAYYRTALKFSSSELVHSLKVISDNREHGIENLNAKLISDLVRAKCKEIEQFATALLDVPTVKNMWPVPIDDIAHLHCTVSQARLFEELSHRHRVLGSYDEDLQAQMQDSEAISDALRILSEKLATAAPEAKELL